MLSGTTAREHDNGTCFDAVAFFAHRSLLSGLSYVVKCVETGIQDVIPSGRSPFLGREGVPSKYSMNRPGFSGELRV